jgi:hypothetical protein
VVATEASDRKRRISQLKVDLWVNSGSRGLHV